MRVAPNFDTINNKRHFNENSLFKFMGSKFLPLSENGFMREVPQFRFTSPYIANDPFELWTTWLKYNAMLGGHINPNSKFYANPNLFFGLFNDNENPISFFGALSLTTEIENHLMWAHYASNFEGFAIELDKSHSFFQTNIDPINFNYFDKVVYDNTTPEITDEQIEKIIDIRSKLKIKQKFDFENFPFHIYFRKSTYWTYEDEYRLIKPLRFADKIIEINTDKEFYQGRGDIDNIHLFTVPFDAIKSFILGWKVHPDLPKYLYEELQQHEVLKHIKVFQTIHPIVQYKIQIEEYNWK